MGLCTNEVPADERKGIKPLSIICCSHCGATDDLVWRREYVGGQGYEWFPRCRDEVECWQRWDEQHGIAHC